MAALKRKTAVKIGMQAKLKTYDWRKILEAC